MNVSGKHPNPQGKGMTPVLENLQQTTNSLSVPAKDIHRITNELFTSLFVLNSQIRFKPVCGQYYWLYRKDGTYRLSLIAPEQWTADQSGRYVGACQLQNDLTWTLELSIQSRNDPQFITEIACQRQRFEKNMQQAEKVDDMLPIYKEHLPFYSRVLASALSYSLQNSMQKGGISGMNYKQANKKEVSETKNNQNHSIHSFKASDTKSITN